jgi:excisionase family DNA binding protein
MTTNEHKLARTLIAAHVDPAVAPIVLDAVDGWADVVTRARYALEQSKRSADDLHRYYTVADLMRLLRKSDSGVRAMLDDGTLPTTRVGGSIRVPIEAVERYLTDHTTRPDHVPRRTARARRSPQDEETIQRYPFLAD